MPNILEVQNLSISFSSKSPANNVVNNLSFSLDKGDIFGIVGASGSGKSMTALSIMKLLPSRGQITSGQIIFEGKDLVKARSNEMRKIRGNQISMIFQDPMTSLNPLFKIGDQIKDVITRHQNVSHTEAKNRTIDILTKVGVQEPKIRYHSYPHEFSGGMRQRVMIAMAIACRPKVLIADEPTTALDVSTQVEILKLLLSLRDQLGLTILLITHDFGIVANLCNRMLVMKTGNCVEEGDVKKIFQQPSHPYTKSLLASLPVNLNQEKLRIVGDFIDKK